MGYNRYLWNSALYNAGREEIGAVARSVIQAHTGPHVRAVIGQIPSGKADQSGIALLSDFIITEGLVRKPPTSFKFPDLSAVLRAVQEGTADLGAWIRGWYYKDLPASIFLVDKIPDLPAFIFALLEQNLPATIIGKLAEKDLPAFIYVTVANLGGFMQGVRAPTLEARIFVQPPGNLGAKIHTPLDLGGIVHPVYYGDLPADIVGFGARDLPAFMFGQPAPILRAMLKGFASDFSDIPAIASSRDETDIGAAVTSSIPGPNDFLGIINGIGGINDVIGFLRSVGPGRPEDLGATIGQEFGVIFDLRATINFLGAKKLKGIITTFPVGEKDRYLPANLQPLHVHPGDLGGSLITNDNLKDLGAILESGHVEVDLNAFLRVSETFITAILIVTTLAGRDLRATIGKPECRGGVGRASVGGSLQVQYAKSLGASVDSFIERSLRAVINTGNFVHALDFIDILYSRARVRNPTFFAIDTIDVNYAPFRGYNLGASIAATSAYINLGATVTAAFPLPSVIPSVSHLLAADLRFGEELDIQEVRFQLEGALLEYIYVNGSDRAFIQDPYQNWKINIRSFRPIAENLFGDFAAGRVCRLGDLTSFSTLDEAIRACIDSVIGLQGQANMGASVLAAGQLDELPAYLTVSDIFTDMPAIANRVYPIDFGATITAIEAGVLKVAVKGVGFPIGSTVNDLSASIAQMSTDDLALLVTASGGPPFQPGVMNAVLLSAILPLPTQISNLEATISSV